MKEAKIVNEKLDYEADFKERSAKAIAEITPILEKYKVNVGVDAKAVIVDAPKAEEPKLDVS